MGPPAWTLLATTTTTSFQASTTRPASPSQPTLTGVPLSQGCRASFSAVITTATAPMSRGRVISTVWLMSVLMSKVLRLSKVLEETVDQVSDKLVEATPIAVTALETSIDCQVDERYDVVPSADDTVDQVSDKLFEVTPVAITALETSVQEELDVDKGKSYISSGDQIDGTTLLTNVAVNMKPELDAVAQAAEDYYLTPTTPDKESIGVPSPITDTADKEMEADFHDVGSFKSEKTAAQISIDYITAEPRYRFLRTNSRKSMFKFPLR
ncbi:hypothetical protein BC829DRAFT_38241 [Chytridium lagenaria]|nr:hypothetical protein BC829DRAFT_38241 [Chytridium lagenaria]